MVAVYGIIAFLSLAVLIALLLPLHADTSGVGLRLRRRFSLMFGVFFVLGTLLLYALLGSSHILPLVASRQLRLAELRTTILADSTALKADPKDLSAWLRLGQSFMETGQYNAAANAFRRAVVLSHGNPLIILAYTSALVYEADGKITDDAKKNVEMVLLQQPQNPEARYLMAVRLLQEGKQDEAMKRMKDLYKSLPEDSSLKALIDAQIGKR